MQIQISWLLKKPADLDLHCLQRQGISWFSKTRVNFQNSSVLVMFCVVVHIHIATDKGLFSSEKCWYLSYFSTKTYVVGTHNICLRRLIRKILCGYPLLSVAMYPWCKKYHIYPKYLYTCHKIWMSVLHRVGKLLDEWQTV